MSSVVVVDDVSPVVRTGDVGRVRYRGSGVVGVPKTQHSVLCVCCVCDVQRKAQEVQGADTFIFEIIDEKKHDVYEKKNKIAT